MENIDLYNIKIFEKLIKTFNKNINYEFNNNKNSLSDFIIENQESILETIDFINIYIDIYNKLNNLNLEGIEVPSTDIYTPEYLESLINLYNNDNNNYLIKNLLFNQKIILYNNLQECQKGIFKILNITNAYYEFAIEHSINYNEYISKIIKIFNEDDDSSSEPLTNCLAQLNIVLKSTYGIKKKNVKVKVLKRFY